MLKIVIALLGWFLLGGYLFYEYRNTDLPSSRICFGGIYCADYFPCCYVLNAVYNYLFRLSHYQKEKLLKKVVTEKAKEDAILGP